MIQGDFYKILGVSPTTSAEDIRKAYLHLARQYHPDLNSGDKSAEEKFKLISNAYMSLTKLQKLQNGRPRRNRPIRRRRQHHSPITPHVAVQPNISSNDNFREVGWNLVPLLVLGLIVLSSSDTHYDSYVDRYRDSSGRFAR